MLMILRAITGPHGEERLDPAGEIVVAVFSCVLGDAAEHRLGGEGDPGLVIEQFKQLRRLLGGEHLSLADHPGRVVGAVERRTAAAGHRAVCLYEPV
jgi:hypothetical protein